MRRLITTTLLAAALATPALALTVSPAPNRDQAAHLKSGKTSGSGSVDLRDTLAGGGRPFAGGRFSDSGTYRQTQTFSFGNVTTTITSEPDFFQPYRFDEPRRRILVSPELVGRRR